MVMRLHKYRKMVKVHRLVCLAFNGPPPFEGALVLHIDENGLNNRPGNLMWGTQKENMNAPNLQAWRTTRVGDLNPRRIGMAKRRASCPSVP
jgi:hypothetical protein